MTPQQKNSNNIISSYRNKASFNSKKLQELFETSDAVEFKNLVFTKLENDPLFKRSPLTESLDEIRKKSHLKARRLLDYGFIHDPRGQTHPLYFQSILIAMVQYDVDIVFKTTLNTNFFGACVRGLGSAEQQKYYADALDEKVAGCFALTEIAHGTDAKRMRTTAVYDPQSKQFVLHTEDFQAAKCWIGNLGQAATHAIVFAQLIMPDGKNEGLHGFMTPIRNPETFLPYPGVTIGDMGEKIGCNGMDNGFCMFNKYRIPRENLLSKFGTVTEDDEYLSPIPDPRKRFGLSLGTLISGRVGVVNISIGLLSNALTISIRYSAVRKQFGPTDDEELSIIEYPLQQWRLFPYLAGLYAMKAAAKKITLKHFNLMQTMYNPEKIISQEEAEFLTELHGVLSSLKAQCSWMAQTGIQQCREACGGHGYLKSSGLLDLRNSNDANCTYEGDNNVLQQQASNWLVKLWRDRAKKRFPSPLGSIAFLYNATFRSSKMLAQSEKQLCHPPTILEMYQWLVCYLIERTTGRLQALRSEGCDGFTAQNHSQVYCARSLAMAFGEHFLLKCLWEQTCEIGKQCKQSQAVLTKLCSLYGLFSLEKHMAYMHQGNYLDSSQSELIHLSIVRLCEQLKDDAVSLVDVVAPPDFVLNSVIGQSNGEVYKNLEEELMPSTNQRPDWWPELSGKLRSRL